ncbi:MAG: hypothetical protein B7Z13_06870 [Caulobacterales bacterium 32-67-6]|nr:MAG: hypothetical protein B7Z13_06870 [Caulobacterales bacterium 32-67-6]
MGFQRRLADHETSSSLLLGRRSWGVASSTALASTASTGAGRAPPVTALVRVISWWASFFSDA